MTKAQRTYADLNDELEEIIVALQQEDTDIDVAVQHYKRGLELVNQLELRLKTAGNTIEELKATFSDS